MRKRKCLSLALLAAAGPARGSPQATKGSAVVVSGPTTAIEAGDEVSFQARVRPDLAMEIRRGSDAGAFPLGPRLIGWHWVSDLDNTDTITKACPSPTLTCKMFVGWSGTIVFSIQVHDQVCAGWLHIDAIPVPELGEKDSTRRMRFESIHRAMKTKAPTWPACSV